MSNVSEPLQLWKRACDNAYRFVESSHFEVQADTAIEEAKRYIKLGKG